MKVINLLVFTMGVFLLLSGCSNQNGYINILSDDISLIECVNLFNAKNNDVKIVFNYQKAPNDKNLFELVNSKKIKDIDIVAGTYNPTTILQKKYFIKIPSLFNKKDNIFNSVKQFTNIEDNLIIPYAIDFPVIIARKDVLPKDLSTDYLSIEQFTEIARSVNFVKKRERYTEKRLGFVPSLSYYPELEYYFIFNSIIRKKGSGIIFNSPQSQMAFNFYHIFDSVNNYSNKFVKEYKKHFAKIDKKFYLKMKVISIDFIPFSKASLYPQSKYKIFFIKGLKNISLTLKTISILKKSQNKNSAIKFIKFILSDKQQEMLYKNHLANLDYYQNIFLPIKKDIIKNYQLNFLNSQMVEKNIANYTYPNFININTQKMFLQRYKQVKELIENGLLDNNKFLEKF